MSISREWRIGDLSLTDWPFAVAFGSDHGSPDSSADVLPSFLTDGDLELTFRDGNRTITLPVLIEESDMAALAKAQGDLDRECRKSLNTLYHDPGDGFGEPYQFTVFRGSPVWQQDDDYEQAGYRLFQVTWRALPWPEAAEEVTVASLSTSGSTTTSVDDMSSASAWTATVAGAAVTPIASSGTVTASSPTPLGGGFQVVTATRTGTINTSTTKYLVLDWKDYSTSGGTLTASADGVALFKLAEGPAPTVGYRRSTFQVAVNSVASVTFSLNTSPPGAPSASATRGLVMDQLSRTDILPISGSTKQQLRIIPVAGSMPSRGSLSVQHETSALGDVLIYTAADDGGGYTPACRLYRVAGVTPVADSSAVSGFYDPVGVGPSTYQIPTGNLPPGDYGVMVRARSITSPSSLQVQLSAQVDSTPIGATWNSPVVAVAVSSTYALYRAGMVRLPLADTTSGALSTIFAGIVNLASGVTAYVDELYLFNLTAGRLSQFQCGSGFIGSGGNSNRLWVESPSTDNDGLGRYLRGTAANASDAHSALLTSGALPAVHEFPPGSVKTFVVTTAPTTPATVSYRYRPAGHSAVYSGS